MRRLLSLTRRELLAYLVSAMGAIIAAVFLLVNGITCVVYLGIWQGDLEALVIYQFTLPPFWFLMLLVPPLLTMRAFAEERRTGTFELLVTSGCGDAVLVTAKFLGAWGFLLLLWLLTLPLFGLLEFGADVDWGMLLCIHLGLALLGALLTAIGVCASTLSQNQLVAGGVALVANLLLFFVTTLRHLYETGSYPVRFLQYVSPAHHFTADFTRGIFDLRYVIFYGSLTLLFLFLAVKSLERRRWW